MESELLDSRLKRAREAAALREAICAKEEMEAQCKNLKAQLDHTTEELVALKMYISTIQKEKRQSSALKRLKNISSSDFPNELLQMSSEALSKAQSLAPGIVPILEQLHRGIKLQSSRVSDSLSREREYIQVLRELSVDTSMSARELASLLPN